MFRVEDSMPQQGVRYQQLKQLDLSLYFNLIFFNIFIIHI